MEVFHTDRISESDFDHIVAFLRAGGVIGFPTDTAYGLGADPFNESAVERIFQIKGRAESKPILVLVCSIVMVEQIAQPNAVFERVAEEFWPGPLTIILSALSGVSEKVTAGTGTVGVRWPRAQFANKLVERFQRPITATSANRSNMSACITADEVRAQLGESVSVLIDGGTLPARSGSTLLDLTADPPVLLREGPISFDRLRVFFEGRIREQNA